MRQAVKTVPAIIGTLTLLTLMATANADNDARPMPDAYGFPADHLQLLESLDRIDYRGMRQHAWNLWAGITHQDTRDGVAVFETWYPADNVFSSAPNPPAHTRSFRTHFEAAKQHPGNKQHSGESLISHVMYNQSARDHILNNGLNQRATLETLNTRFNTQKTPRFERSITRFPRDAIAIKMVWWPVKAKVATLLPVWDGPYLPRGTDGSHPAMPAEDWPNAVWVLPPGIKVVPARAPRADVNMRGTVKLNNFYSFRITREMLGHLDAAEQDGFSHVEAGDYAVLLAMHVTTREIHNWVWATYWWHDQPDAGSLAEDRPKNVKGIWRHFLMNTAFSIDTPGAPDGGAHIAYNPYIEAKFKNGVQSNCAACHNRASYPALTDHLCGALPITRGSHDFQPTSPDREGRTKLEFLWSLLIRPEPGPPACLQSGG